VSGERVSMSVMVWVWMQDISYMTNRNGASRWLAA
jgi:hypothetical protein